MKKNTRGKKINETCNLYENKYLNDESDEILNRNFFEIHERTAQAIVNEVVTNDEPCGIALVGKWGSGKSAVLHLVEEKIDAKKYKLFIFDAWSHGGDSLRRNFLTSLGNFLFTESDKFKDGKTTWTELRKHIEGAEIEETQIEQAVYPAIVGGFIAFAFLYTILSVFFNEGAPVIPLPVLDNASVVYTVPAISSIIVFLFLCFKNKTKQAEAQEKNEDTKPFVKKAVDLFTKSLYSILDYAAGQSPSTLSRVIKRSPEIDSVAFEGYYKQILVEASKRGLKVVIAIDNLDRLSDLEREEVWSSMQIFLGTGIDKPYRPYIILPYSPDLYQSGEKNNENCSDREKGKAAGTISKLFIRRYDLPEPIVSDWKNCFIALFSEAFSEVDKKMSSVVFSIAYSAEIPYLKKTPREAKRFINEIVSLSRVYPEVEIKYIAEFCQLKARFYSGCEGDDFTAFMTLVISRKDPEALNFIAAQFTDIDECLLSLAMMTFGVFTPEKAEEAYLMYRVEQAMRLKEGIPVSELVRENHGTWNALFEILRKELQAIEKSTNLVWLGPTIKNIEAIKPTTEHTKMEKDKILKLLISYLHFTDWPAYQGISSVVCRLLEEGILERTSISKQRRYILSSADAHIYGDNEAYDNTAKKKLVYWLEETSEVMNRLIDLDLMPEIIEMSSFEGGTGALVECMARAEADLGWIERIEDPQSDSFFSVMSFLVDRITLGKVIEEDEWEVLSILPSVVADDIDNADYGNYASYGIEESLKAYSLYMACWKMVFEHKISSPRAKTFIDFFRLSSQHASSLFSSFDTLNIEDQLILADFALESPRSQGTDFLLNQFIALSDYADLGERYAEIFGKDSVQRLLSHEADSLKWDFAEKMFVYSWEDDRFGDADISACLKRVQLEKDSVLQGQMGDLLVANERESELCGTEYNPSLILFYNAVLQKTKSKDYRDWVYQALQEVSSEEWMRSLETPRSIKIIMIVNLCSDKERPVPEALTSEIPPIILNGHFKTGKMASLIECIGIEKMSDIVFQSFFTDDDKWRHLTDRVGEKLIDLGWVDLLTPADRFAVTGVVLKSNRKKSYEWLEMFLTKRGSQKARESLRGYIIKTRELLEQKLTIQLGVGARQICKNLLEGLKE